MVIFKLILWSFLCNILDNVVTLLACLQGNLKEALDEYQDVVKVDPTDFRPYLCQVLYPSIHIHPFFQHMVVDPFTNPVLNL
jgi:hypothetical protein